MKNLKVILSTIGVTAIVGTALAMSAPLRDDTWCARPKANGSGTCTLTSYAATEGTGTTTHYAYKKTGTTCPNQCTILKDLDPQ